MQPADTKYESPTHLTPSLIRQSVNTDLPHLASQISPHLHSPVLRKSIHSTPQIMAPPTPLSVATNSINRLLKEESSYRTELATQQRRVEKLQAGGGGESDDDDDDGVGNMEFRLRQEV